MKYGKKYSFGDVILTEVQFTDTFELRTKPAVVLFEEFNNIVAAAITSNPHMKGIPLTEEEGMIQDSIIKLNYIFTISEKMVKKELFSLSKRKKEIVKRELIKRFA